MIRWKSVWLFLSYMIKCYFEWGFKFRYFFFSVLVIPWRIMAVLLKGDKIHLHLVLMKGSDKITRIETFFFNVCTKQNRLWWRSRKKNCQVTMHRFFKSVLWFCRLFGIVFISSQIASYCMNACHTSEGSSSPQTDSDSL